MTTILLIVALSAILCGMVYPALVAPQLGIEKPQKSRLETGFIFMLIIGIGARCVAAGVYPGHGTDMNCFYSWANSIYQDGFGGFYTSGAFADYPPGYMYVLYVFGWLQQTFSFSKDVMYLLLKIPAILCDGACAWLVYRIAKKYWNPGLALLLSAFYMFNPAVFLDSALWGQVDSVFTLLVVAVVFMITEKRLIPAYFLFGLSVLVKPQAFIFMPILICGVLEQVFFSEFSMARFWKNLLWGLAAIVGVVVLCLPFGISNVFAQYLKTLGSYPYLTVNAFNLWGALGQNWQNVGVVTSALGYIFLAGIVAFSVLVFLKAKRESKYYFMGAVLSFLTFMLSTKMHERYGFAAMIFLLICFSKEQKLKLFLSYVALSLSQFFNMAYVLFIYEQDPNFYYRSPVVVIASIVNLAILVYFFYVARDCYLQNDQPLKPKQIPQKEVGFINSAPKIKLTRFDYLALVLIVAIYSGVAFYNLGDRSAPETDLVLSGTTTVRLDLGKEQELSKVRFFLGPYHLHEDNVLILACYNEADEETFIQEFSDNAVFFWSEEELPKTPARFLDLSVNGVVSLKELAIYDTTGTQITPVNTTVAPALFDEQGLIPERQSFRNSTYFDEIYHARTAYEFIEKLHVYEWTHPPLGKFLISLGIRVLGMNPFGWRVVGVLFGIFMIPVIYVFSKKLFRYSWLSCVACVLFSFDFMHFAQTRIATIDVYVTFFIMLMYAFMYWYYTMSFHDTPFQKTLLPLGLCGISMGLGIACKWTGVYAGVGLAVVFFITLYRRYKEYRYALADPAGETDGIRHETVISKFIPYTRKTILFCLVFFVVVPLLIYVASYMPYLSANGSGLDGIWQNQESMLTYHGKTVVESTHSFSSRWYQWPILYKPIWYYSGTISETLKEGISSFGNPLVWWVGILAFLYVAWRMIRHKDRTALFLVIAYLAQVLPWTVVERTTFIYHYFPAVPFVVLMIGYSIWVLYQNHKHMKPVSIVYAVLTMVLFGLFYPVLSGYPVDPGYVEQYLAWFRSWHLI